MPNAWIALLPRKFLLKSAKQTAAHTRCESVLNAPLAAVDAAAAGYRLNSVVHRASCGRTTAHDIRRMCSIIESQRCASLSQLEVFALISALPLPREHRVLMSKFMFVSVIIIIITMHTHTCSWMHCLASHAPAHLHMRGLRKPSRTS